MDILEMHLQFHKTALLITFNAHISPLSFLCEDFTKHSNKRLFPLPLPSPPHLQRTCDVIRLWMQVQGVNEEQVLVVLAFLNEDYLRSIPFPMGAFFARGPNGAGIGSLFSLLGCWVGLAGEMKASLLDSPRTQFPSKELCVVGQSHTIEVVVEVSGSSTSK